MPGGKLLGNRRSTKINWKSAPGTYRTEVTEASEPGGPRAQLRGRGFSHPSLTGSAAAGPRQTLLQEPDLAGHRSSSTNSGMLSRSMTSTSPAQPTDLALPSGYGRSTVASIFLLCRHTAGTTSDQGSCPG